MQVQRHISKSKLHAFSDILAFFGLNYSLLISSLLSLILVHTVLNNFYFSTFIFLNFHFV